MDLISLLDIVFISFNGKCDAFTTEFIHCGVFSSNIFSPQITKWRKNEDHHCQKRSHSVRPTAWICHAETHYTRQTNTHTHSPLLCKFCANERKINRQSTSSQKCFVIRIVSEREEETLDSNPRPFFVFNLKLIRSARFNCEIFLICYEFAWIYLCNFLCKHYAIFNQIKNGKNPYLRLALHGITSSLGMLSTLHTRLLKAVLIHFNFITWGNLFSGYFFSWKFSPQSLNASHENFFFGSSVAVRMSHFIGFSYIVPKSMNDVLNVWHPST